MEREKNKLIGKQILWSKIENWRLKILNCKI